MPHMATSSAPVKVKTQLVLPEALYDKYAERATKAGHTPEAEMTVRLARCAEHTDPAPLYLTSEQRNRLNIISGSLIDSSEALINWAHRLSRLKVSGIEITLDERLLSRIDSRRFGATLAERITKMVIDGLEQQVGMR
jgi:hypothetical protein